MNSLIKVDVTQAVIGLDPKAEQGIAELLMISEQVQSVGNQQELGLAVHASNQLKKHPIYGFDAIEQTRTQVKAPVLELGRRIDDLAKQCKAKLQPEMDRIRDLRDAFIRQEKVRTDELERQRQAEIAAIEAAHQAADKALNAALDKLTEPDSSLMEAELAVSAKETVDQLVEARDAKLRSKPVTLDKPVGLVVKNVLRFEVTDPAALYAQRPDFFDLVEKRRVISDNITPSTTLPGLRVWQETVTETR